MRKHAACVFCVLGLLILASAARTGATEDWRQVVREATWFVPGDNCTALAVDERTLLTASHCVGRVGDRMRVLRIAGREERATQVVFDDPRTDYAVLRSFLRLPGRHFWRRGRTAQPGERLWSYTCSMALLGWESELTAAGIYTDARAWRRVMVARGAVYPGASGAVVWDADGDAQFLITHGLAQQTPPIVLGPLAADLKLPGVGE